MARVQHVDSEVGPLERRLGLASVWVHTASGAFEIPALDAERARASCESASLASRA